MIKSNVCLLAFILGLACLQTKRIQAFETTELTVSDLNDLYILVQKEAPTNFSISADVIWKRYPVHPISTPNQIDAYVERQIKKFKSEGVVSSHDQEASIRDQIRKSMMKYSTYVGVGRFEEYYYNNKMRLNKVLYDGTNASLAKMRAGAIADVYRDYVVLDVKKISESENTPVILIDPRTKSALKTISHSPSEVPVLRKAFAPDIYPRAVLASLLGKAINQKSGLAFEFDEKKASQLISGVSPSGYMVSMQISNLDGATTRKFVFKNSALGINKTNKMRLEFDVTTTTNCVYLSRDLLDLSPNTFIDEMREFGSNCMPEKFSFSVHNAHADGYDYNFENISIKTITPSEAHQLFFDKCPKNYFFEDESSGKRMVVNLPVGMSSSIKDPTGAYGQPNWFKRNKLIVIRVVILTIFLLPLPFFLFSVLKKKNLD